VERRIFALVFLCLACLAPFLRGQSTNAWLTGRITDPTKAVIVGARIEAINGATNLRYEATSNSSGEYHLANLPPGAYRIEIEKPGFKKLIKPDVVLHVQDALRIDLALAIGPASASIAVEAVAIGVRRGIIQL
jgi:Carboxypeptidase regulatory-like domain